MARMLRFPCVNEDASIMYEAAAQAPIFLSSCSLHAALNALLKLLPNLQDWLSGVPFGTIKASVHL